MIEEKILLVDDEKEFIDVLAERMSLRGMKVVTASDGEMALAEIRKSNFDAVILDMMMPGINGIETLKKALALDSGLQVIFLTGHATIKDSVEAVKAGAVDYLEKPADVNRLVEMIKEAKIRRMILVEKKSEEAVREIMRKKGW